MKERITFEKLKNPPIREAVIAITTRTEFSEADIPRVKELATGYTEFRLVRELQQLINLSPEASVIAEHKVADLGFKGVRFQSEDGRQIVQFNRDGMVLSIIKNYQSRGEMIAHFSKLWEIYSAVAKPADIQRIGVRFINQVITPSQEPAESDYFHTQVQKPQDLDAQLQNFIYRELYAITGTNIQLAITKAMYQHQGTGFAHILDIDAYTNAPMRAEKNLIDTCLEKLWYYKNKAFFESLSDKAKREFNQ